MRALSRHCAPRGTELPRPHRLLRLYATSTAILLLALGQLAHASPDGAADLRELRVRSSRPSKGAGSSSKTASALFERLGGRRGAASRAAPLRREQAASSHELQRILDAFVSSERASSKHANAYVEIPGSRVDEPSTSDATASAQLRSSVRARLSQGSSNSPARSTCPMESTASRSIRQEPHLRRLEDAQPGHEGRSARSRCSSARTRIPARELDESEYSLEACRGDGW